MGNPGFLEIIYGVLFDPVRTFRRLAEDPPLLPTLVIVTLVNALGAMMNILTIRAVTPAGLGQGLEPALLDTSMAVTAFALAAGPYLILAGFFLWYIKWLGYGAILHLTAQLLDGKGGPKGTLVAYGLAGLPAILMLPVEGLMVFTDPGETTASTILGLFSLAVFIWSVVLLVLGLREMHQLSTGRAVTVVLAPVGVVLLAAVIVLVLIISGIITLFPALPDFPGGF